MHITWWVWTWGRLCWRVCYVILGSDMKESMYWCKSQIHPAVIIMIRMQYSPCLVSLGCSGWRTQSSPSRRGRSRTWDVFRAGHSSRRCERCGPLVCEHPKKSAAQAGARTPECHVWKSSDLVGTLSLDSCPTHTSLRYVTLVACSSFMIIVFRMTIASLRWTTLDFSSKKNDSIFLYV